MIDRVKRLYETIVREWQNLFERYNQVLGALGDNDFEV